MHKYFVGYLDVDAAGEWQDTPYRRYIVKAANPNDALEQWLESVDPTYCELLFARIWIRREDETEAHTFTINFTFEDM